MQPNGIPVFQVRQRGHATPIAERMRDFRRRHPGYDREYKAKRRAAQKARLEAMALAAQVAEPVLMKIPVPQVLMLPAPTIDPTLAAINEMIAKLDAATQAIRVNK